MDGSSNDTSRDSHYRSGIDNKAIVQEKYGSSEVLKLMEIDKPAVNDDAVLVRVHAPV